MDQGKWNDHCRNAFEKFLISAVIIDDNPVVDTSSPSEKKILPPLNLPADDGMGIPPNRAAKDPSGGSGTGDTSVSEISEQPESHPQGRSELNIRLAADAFSEKGISCSFLLPENKEKEDRNEEKDDREAILRRALTMTAHADLTILDWYLKGTDPGLTLDIIKELMKKDQSLGGRLRLICIYTNQTQSSSIIEQCRQSIKEVVHLDLVVEENQLHSECFSLLVCNKYDVPIEKLPQKLIDVFKKFADGLLPAFAMSSVAAIRRNIHHIITQFSQDLDSGYVSNRLISNPPADMAELMRDLFVSECDAAIGIERVIDECLENDIIENWLMLRIPPSNNDNNNYDRKFLIALSKDHSAIGNKKLKIEKSDESLSSSKYKKIFNSVHGNEDSCRKIQRKFARLVALRWEAFGRSKKMTGKDWKPTLTLGTLLVKLNHSQTEVKPQYYYCLTPACDTVRLHNKRKAFLFLEMEADITPTTLIVMSHDNQELKLNAEFKPERITKILFRGDERVGRVLGGLSDEGKYIFTAEQEDSENTQQQFLWLGEVRTHRAQRDLAEFTKQWMRFGIIDSEYLRLCPDKDLKISF